MANSYRRFAKAAAVGLALGSAAANAGVIQGTYLADGITGGARWDYAPRTLTIFGQPRDRSLSNGLSFNMQGGSFQAYRDLFSWSGGTPPSVADFKTAVEQAFDAWTVMDPVSRFGTKLSFRFDSTVAVAGISTVNAFSRDGAEIDLFGSGAAGLWGSSSAGIRGLTTVAVEDELTVKLTSGVANYFGSRVISGADIVMNSQSSAQYTLDSFRRILTHEIGHAIGLGDVDVGTVKFIDNNYDGTSAASRAATLSDSWASLVNPLDPSNSAGLRVYTLSPGVFSTAGVNLLMESNGLGVWPGNPLSDTTPLTNDEYGTRQFLYPDLAPVPVPEPAEYLLFGLGLLAVAARVRALRAR